MVLRRETQSTRRNRSRSDTFSPQTSHGLALVIHITPSFHTSGKTQYASNRETSHLISEREITVVKTSHVCEIHA